MSTGYISKRAKIKDEVNVFEPVISTTEGGYITDIIAGDNITISGAHETPRISAKDTTYTAGENITITSDNVISATGGGSTALQPLDATETSNLVYTQLTGTKTKDGVIGIPSSIGHGLSEQTVAIRKSGGTLEVSDPVAMADAVNLEYLQEHAQEKLTAGDNVTIENNVISAKDTTYTAGTNITISEDNVISASGGSSGGMERLIPPHNDYLGPRRQFTDSHTGSTTYHVEGREWYTIPGSDDLLLVLHMEICEKIGGSTGITWTYDSDTGYYTGNKTTYTMALTAQLTHFAELTGNYQYIIPEGYSLRNGTTEAGTECAGYLLPAIDFKVDGIVCVVGSSGQHYWYETTYSDCNMVPRLAQINIPPAMSSGSDPIVFSTNHTYANLSAQVFITGNIYSNGTNFSFKAINGDPHTSSTKYTPWLKYHSTLYVHVFATKSS